MKTTLKTALRLVIYTSVGIGTLLLLDNNSRYFMFLPFVVFVMLLTALFLPSVRKDVLCIAALHYALVFGYIFCGSIRVNNLGMDRVEIKSPIGRSLHVGEKVDTITLRTVVEAEYASYRGRAEDYYVVYHRDQAHIFNRYRKILTLNRDFTIVHRQYYGVTLDFLCDKGTTYSLHDGRIVDGNFKPYLRDITPVDSSL